jgi:(hydroxyamino)benzene mutase
MTTASPAGRRLGRALPDQEAILVTILGTDGLRHLVARAGAWLFAVGLATGLWAGVVLTGAVTVPIPRLALAAHLNGILGGLWLIAVAATLDRLRYGLAGRRRLALAVLVATWANWLITLIASVLGVRGLEYTSDLRNNAIAVLLEVFVVLPSLVAAFVWAWGFGGPPRARGEL